MINNLRKLFLQHKYKLGVLALLSVASAVCVTLVVARIAYSDSERYTTLIWNLFLAWIPCALAYLVYMLSWRRKLIYFVIPVFAFLWLIFFPNAPYILTDLQHLSQDPGVVVPVWYDVILLVWFSWTGMMLGIISLSLMQEIIRREFSRRLGWIFVFAVAGLSSAGVYIGRFIRLNSWDVFRNPAESADNLWSWLSDPSLRSLGFIGLYTLFFIFVYLILYAFSHISQDHRPASE
jgi:uncharacterized membrane protein